MSFKNADLETRVENMLKIATVHEVDEKTHQLKVKSGGLISDWLPHPAQIGHNFRAWSPLRAGAQVMVACPSGDFAQAVIIRVLYSDELLSPGNNLLTDVIVFNDGTTIKKTPSDLSVVTPCDVLLSAPNAVLNTNVKHTGDFESSGGKFTHNNKNVGHDHKHKGVTPGKSKTKGPV